MRNEPGKSWALKPLIYEDPLYQLLREGNVQEFNQRKTQGEKATSRVAISAISTCAGSTPPASTLPERYFRAADLRGVDFSKACLVGVSINGARISGAFFPVELSAEEISLSIQHRTRMRYNKCARAILGASAKLRRATHALARIRKPLQTDIEAMAQRQSSQSICRRRNVGMSYLSSSS